MKSSEGPEGLESGSAEVERGLARLCERYSLPPDAETKLAMVLAGLAGDARAPTTVKTPLAALGVHLADSLIALEVEPVCRADSLADIGAGAGFPGLPLAVALPRSTVGLVESQARKCEFIERLCASADITNAQVANVRAEEWRAGLGAQDVVLARALAAQSVVLEYAAPLLRKGGVLVDWRGGRDAEEEGMAAVAAAELGLRRLEIRHVEPYEGAREHHLHVYEKVEATPERFPRRAGIARKRPLGSR